MADKNALVVQGQPLGKVFQGLVDDLARTKVPYEVLPAIDLKLTFNLTTTTEKGFKFIFTDTKTKGSSLTVQLATRVHRTTIDPSERPQVDGF